MNEAHLHLLLNHSPIIGSGLAAFLLIFELIRGNVTILQVGIWILVVSAALGFASYITGDGAEHTVIGMPGMDRHLIHEHEEASVFATWGTIFAAAIGAFTLWKSLRMNAIPKGWAWGTTIVTLWAFSTMARTGYLGGQIAHPEAREGFVAPPRPPRPNHTVSPEAAEQPERAERPE